MDRRIKRTRTAVFNAVLDLMVEKDTSKITVLELCKRADINKSTFYLHYKSMDDCLQNCFQIIMNGIINISKKIDYNEIKHNPQPAVDRLLDEVEKNIEYLSKFKSSSITSCVVKISCAPFVLTALSCTISISLLVKRGCRLSSISSTTKSAPFSSACNHPPMRAKKCCVPTDSCSIKS